MRKYSVFWEVDGASGHTFVMGQSVEHVRQWFAFYYARHGYVLKSIGLRY